MVWTISLLSIFYYSIKIGLSAVKVNKLLLSPFMISLTAFFYFMDLQNNMGLDFQLETSLVILTLGLWIPTTLSVFQTSFIKNKNMALDYLFNLFVILLLIFFSKSLLTFFIFFELSVIPIIIIIFLGGSAKTKGEASFFLFLFTGLSAFFLLFFISFFALKNSGDLNLILSFSYESISKVEFSWFLSNFFSFVIILSLLVKLPIFFFHMWLPKAHVEAPVFGSMILASVMLKLGGFGIYLLSSMLLFNNFILLLVSMMPYLCFLSGISCYSQKDLKVLIALSSVNHMSFFLMGFICLQAQSIWGGLMLMLGHGVVSSMMFYFSSIVYSLTSSRSIFFSKNFGSNVLLSSIWIFLIFLNGGFPPFLSFLGEISIMKIFIENPIIIFFLFLNFMLVGLYSVLMLSHLSESKSLKPNLNSQGGLNEWTVLMVSFLHLMLLYVLSFSQSIFYL
uniref:NADH-ubiquinone oxidoreductase chain 4 n=1 Tax=Symsagittifera roscoffensis TaxID=84072 RepID=E3UFE7_SYMRO|nr:NADH dehydrogenase subunit 4 [Symsagittifera roscoffensis]ADI75246.1 NADH dehydrogenase subunit 4 [Symsagittifera roscoffensis]